MRIGIDCRLPTYQMGGISQYVLHLLPALAALDAENEYIVLHSRREERDFVPPAAPNFRRHNLWTPCHHRWERWSLAAELLPLGLDVLHSPDFIPPAGGAARRVITIHDLNFVYFPQFLTPESRRYYAEQVQWAVESAAAIAADSRATRVDILAHLGTSPEKVHAIHLAANPLYTRPVPPTSVTAVLDKFDLPPGFLLCVGTLEPRKNLPFLLRVYARLRAGRGLAEPLVLVGKEGWLYEEVFATMDDLGLRPFVRHLRGVADTDLAALYHAAGALATPSAYEGFGLPALEAQHCGCPVVVSNRGSLPEIVGPHGVALDPDDEQGWVDALWAALTDKAQRAEMRRHGLAQAATFRWDKTARQTLALYLDRPQEADEP